MNIYEQVEQLLTSQTDRPAWADEILFELKEIKRLLQERKPKSRYPKKDKAYFAFVNKLREKLRADIQNERYPEIDFHGQSLGINFKGWIYDKKTTEELPAHKAFEVYRFLYDHEDELEKYLKT